MKRTLATGIMAIGMAFLAGCGGDRASLSQPEWQQSRQGTERYAYLWESDLEDEFLFGASVIEVDDFLSNALNMVVRPLKVKLAIEEDKLAVKSADEGESLFKFDLASDGGRHEIDFASAGNDLELRGLIDVLGGAFTVGSMDGLWLSEGAPVVRGVSQDNDTVVVDLIHTVSQVIVGTDLLGNRYVRQRLSDHPGKVLVRLWLKRIKSLPTLPEGAEKTVADAKRRNLGFFAADWMADDSESQPIMRFPIADAGDQEQVIFYLKDFPSEFVEAGREAVASWNQAFGSRIVEARIAPDHVDAGDPRYNVIKWYENLDEGVRWAGVAKPITNPLTGLVMSGGVFVQGDPLVSRLQSIAAFTQQVQNVQVNPAGQIGQVDFTQDEGEEPVIPYFTDGAAPEDYARSYYVETLAHEVGHVLGLRHNFKGSTVLDAEDHSASVMDYTSRAAPALNPGPGAYDLAALRWAYLGRANDTSLPFCTDEDIENAWDCNQGDYGDPVEFTVRGLVDGTNFLTQLTVPVAEDRMISAMKGTVVQAQKLWRLRDSMPEEAKALVEEKLPTAFTYAFEAEPADGLSAEDRAIVEANLARLRKLLEAEE